MSAVLFASLAATACAQPAESSVEAGTSPGVVDATPTTDADAAAFGYAPDAPWLASAFDRAIELKVHGGFLYFVAFDGDHGLEFDRATEDLQSNERLVGFVSAEGWEGQWWVTNDDVGWCEDTGPRSADSCFARSLATGEIRSVADPRNAGPAPPFYFQYSSDPSLPGLEHGRLIAVDSSFSERVLVDDVVNPAGWALYGDFVYFAESGLPARSLPASIKRVPIAGGPVEVVVAEPGSPLADFTLHDGALYWTSTSSNPSAADVVDDKVTVKRHPLGGGGVELVASGTNLAEIILDDLPLVYRTDVGGVTFDRPGAVHVGDNTVVQSVDPWSLVADGHRLFWISWRGFDGTFHAFGSIERAWR